MTPTPSVTPSFTHTLTRTPTRTQTLTATVSATITLTATITPTVTTSPTSGPSFTQTAIPSSTSTSTQIPAGALEDEVLVYPHPVKGGTAWFYYTTSGPAQVVEPGERQNGSIEIFSGLEAGQVVVRDGSSYLSDGAVVEVRGEGS